MNSTNSNITLIPSSSTSAALNAALTLPLIISLYVTVVLSLYEFQIRWNFHIITTSIDARSTKRRTSSAVSRDKMNIEFRYIGPWLRLLCLLAAIVTLLRCIVDFIDYEVNKTTLLLCTGINNFGLSLLILSDTFVYLFLWVRQRVLYNKKCLQHLAKWYIHVMSWISLFLIIGILIAMHVLMAYRVNKYNTSKLRCERIYHVAQDIHGYIWVSSSSVLHALLVLLYVCPLIKHSFSTRSASDPENHHKKTDDLMKAVRRCVVISLTCALTDTITMIVTKYAITAKDMGKLRHSLYNLNAIINVICIVMSLKNWKSMLLPLCKTPHKATVEN